MSTTQPSTFSVRGVSVLRGSNVRRKNGKWTGLTLALAACALIASAVRVTADQIVVGGENYLGAKIVDLWDGHLQFRTVAGELREPWISDVDRIVVDRGGSFVDFNEAERYLADGDAGRAIERYRRALRLSRDFWTELVEVRLLVACLRAGRLREATRSYIHVVQGSRSGPGVAARLIPTEFPKKRSREATQAIEELNAAIADASDDDRRTLLHLLRFEILRRIGDDKASEAAATLSALPIPLGARTPRAYGIQLAALETTLEAHADAATWTNLDRALEFCPESVLPSLLLLKGRTLLRTAATRDEIIRAGWSFMRVVVHMSDDPRAAQGLYGAALVLERIGRGDKAMALLQECLDHKRISEETRTLASAALTRLRSGGGASG
ncbi:MAG: hypothetical protein IIB60_02010 [Planctomycetes bacterium]|nr:hypothetical protein [Planctomycetota bacterium]